MLFYVKRGLGVKFIGRESEVEKLRRFKRKDMASLIVIRGRRRIGKSRLIEEFAEEFSRSFIFTGLPPEEKVTAETQRQEFITQMQQQQIPRLGYDDWSDLFLDLAKHCQKGEVLIALDEITWMGSKDPAFLGKLKTAWDRYFKKNPELVLIISGSDSSWIQENILSSTGFVGRISYRLKLEELPLQSCHHFFSADASPYEMFKVLSVTGGIPRYLEEIKPKSSAERNICDLCFDSGGLLFNEFKQLFSSLFSQRGSTYTLILNSVKNGARTVKEIASALNRKPGGDLSHYLEDLIQAGFIQKFRQWHLTNPRAGELYRYRIRDNYTRFYLKFIEPLYEQIEENGSAELPIGWHTILGLQFESLVVNHSKELHHLLKIPDPELICAGPYFQTKTEKREGCQVDYLIQTKFDTLYLCEVKFSRKELSPDVITEVEEKIRRLERPKSMSIRPILIHVNGVTDELLARDYFANIIDFSDFLS